MVALGDRLIVAQGGGGFQMPPHGSELDAFVVAQARERSARDRPRICFIPTAGADDPTDIVRFYAAFTPMAQPSHLTLFARTVSDIGRFLLAHDAIHIGGGNTANMLAVWRRHGVDQAVTVAWEAGVVMSGMSAGGICWFEGSTTDSFGPVLQPLRDGLGILEGTFVPHYDGEAQRRPLFERLVGEGGLPAGYGVDDGAALVFRGTTLSECISGRHGAAAYRVERRPDGEVTETRLPTRYLGR